MGFFGLFGRTGNADGASVALEAGATGVTPAMLSAAEALPPSVSSRRERSADVGGDIIGDTLGLKVLHGWLQNRHQTLVPLTLNMRVLSPEQRQTVAALPAALVLVGRGPADAEAVTPMLRTWLTDIGADDATLFTYDRALEAPPALNQLFDRAQALDLSIHAYVAALMASDSRYAASLLLCDLVQARFDLPTAVVRSATRRYRR